MESVTGQHKEITLSFMIPGHTKFSPDWGFGLLKKKYRRTEVGGLADLVGVVNESASVNVAQPTGLEDGTVLVTTYDWQEYFKNFCTKVAGIKKFHHIRAYIFVKERAGSPEVKRSILKDESWSPKADELPQVLSPAGQRQWYLYDRIREFCPDCLKDITCPRPSAPPDRLPPPPPSTPSPPLPPTSSSPLRTTSTTTTTSVSDEPPAKRSRLCGACRQPGHNASRCPNNYLNFSFIDSFLYAYILLSLSLSLHTQCL